MNPATARDIIESLIFYATRHGSGCYYAGRVPVVCDYCDGQYQWTIASRAADEKQACRVVTQSPYIRAYVEVRNEG
jgi:hypothetical protein